MNTAELENVPDGVIGWKVDAILNDMAGSALDSFTVGDLVSLAMRDYDNERGVRVISQRKPDGTPGDYHWTAFGDNQIGTGGPGKGAETYAMAAGAAKASRLELDEARELGNSAAGQHLEWSQMVPAAFAAAKVLAPFEALMYIPREEAVSRPGQAEDMSDGPLGDWHWGEFSPDMRRAFKNSVQHEVVGKITDAAASVADPMKIKIPLRDVMSINARQAVLDLADQLNKAALTTFEGLYRPASP